MTRYPLPSGKCGIAWTDTTWNPGLHGCAKVSPACRSCYAEVMAARLARMGQGDYAAPGVLDEHGHWTGRANVAPVEGAVARVLAVPRARSGHRYVFCTSMSDLLHEDVGIGWIAAVIRAMGSRTDITWQVLTKRAERYPDVEDALDFRWPANVWAGVTVESPREAHRLADLPLTAAVTFASVEPMLGPLSLAGSRVGWVIAGGESGEGYRSLDLDAMRALRDECQGRGVAFFAKQAAGVRPRKDLVDLPADLRVREMPVVTA